MKRIILLALLSVIVSVTSYGQYQRHEIYASYGDYTTGKIVRPELGVDNIVAAPYTTSNENLSGTISLGYAYCMSSRFSLGLSYSYSTYKSDVVLGSSIPLANASNTNHLVLINAKFQWVKFGDFSLYSRAGIGVKVCTATTFDNVSEYFARNSEEQKTEKVLAWQASLLGVEWKFIDNLGVFIEGGAGMQGRAIAGLRAHF